MIVGDISPWLTLVLFAFHFVCLLTATVLILNLAGRELGIRELLPEDERTVDDRDASISRLLAITLLPFLGMYAAFGQVQEAANRVVVQQLVRYGVLSDQPDRARRAQRPGHQPAAAAGHACWSASTWAAGCSTWCTTAPAGGWPGSPWC